MRHVQFANPDARRGVILMVVLALLTLFAVLGLSFVLYANAQSKSSDILLAAEEGVGANAIPDISPDTIANAVFNALLYPQDDSTGIYSAYRGYDFARSVFGNNYTYNPATQITTRLANSTPYDGVGRLHEMLTIAGMSVDGYQMVNYTAFTGANGNLVDGFMRDPERLGVRNSTSLNALQPFAGGFNVGYTYPDANNLWLGAIRAGGPTPADYGAVLIQSFHRPWLGFGSLAPTNPNWYIPSVPLTAYPGPQPPGTPPPPNPLLKYMVMRPRPIDQLLANETWDYARNMPYNLATGQYRTKFFPPPLDAGGDVKNLVGSPGYADPATGQYANSDSIWMDFGFPVLTTSNGTKYKPLVAQFIVDLDNVVNVNVHGNIRGTMPMPPPASGNATMHASNQAWGPWEVSLSQVLKADLGPTTPVPQEWVNLFNGHSGPTYGRYGPDGQPGTSGSSTGAPRPGRFYSAMDADAVKDTPPYNLSDPYAFPGAGPAPAFSPFPMYPTSSYGNGNPFELQNNPALNGYFVQTGDDHTFPLSNMEAVLRFGDVGADAIRSDLMNLCQQNLAANTDTAKKIRRLLTTLSMDYDRPGVTPWALAPSSLSGTQFYTLSAGPIKYPTGTQIAFPGAGTTSNGEFGSDGRAVDASLGKIDLNRQLTPYPAAPISPTDPQFLAAVSDRQGLARDIFDRLCFVTTGGVFNPTLPTAPTVGTPQYDALRWLAQLSVNIVDYIDPDDYMTPFHWDPNGPNNAAVNSWVFGTELPRVVLNEVYAECVNSSTDTTGTTGYDVNFWVELHNPFVPDSTDSGVAMLQTGTTAIYQLAIVDSPSDTAFRAATNVTGDTTAAGMLAPSPGTPGGTALVNSWGTTPTTMTIQPASQQYGGAVGGNAGFYVVGPSTPYQNPFPTTTPTYTTTAMNVHIGSGGATSDTNPPPNVPTPPIRPVSTHTFGIYLQRLANPALPFNMTPGPAYNPYITVDYIAQYNPQFGNLQKPPGIAVSSANATPSARSASGRTQPYAANVDPTLFVLQAPTPAATTEPQHTFFRTNGKEAAPPNAAAGNTIKVPFDWLTHMDRQLVSPMELMHVSMFKPHELTQQFMTTATNTFQQRLSLAVANPASRLFRGFEFLTVRPRGVSMSTNSRIPGRININNIWDKETFLALCDKQAANAFTPTDVDTIWMQMMSSRSPSGFPTGADRPFKGFAVPYASPGDPQWGTNGSDTQDTLFRLITPGGNGVFEVPSATAPPGGHPVLRWEVLNKIYNNVTTRSNIFAVWTTVGFFEVIDDTTKPPKLGAEVGLAQHQNIRHRFFAIIDRTNIRDPSQSPPVFIQAAQQNVGPNPATDTMGMKAGSQYVIINAGTWQQGSASLTGTYEGTPWSIVGAPPPALGTALLIDVGPNQENVYVQQIIPIGPGNTAPFALKLQAPLTNNHPEGALINLNAVPGNPGPQPNANPLQDTAVVRYYSVIN